MEQNSKLVNDIIDAIISNLTNSNNTELMNAYIGLRAIWNDEQIEVGGKCNKSYIYNGNVKTRRKQRGIRTEQVTIDAQFISFADIECALNNISEFGNGKIAIIYGNKAYHTDDSEHELIIIDAKCLMILDK